MSQWTKNGKNDSQKGTSKSALRIEQQSPTTIKEEDEDYSPTPLGLQSKIRVITKIEESIKQPKILTNEEIAELKQCFQKFCTTKTLKKHPRSKLNAYGVRQIIPIDPEIDVTLSQKQLSGLFIDAALPLHPQTLSNIYAQIATKKGKGISFADLLQLMKLPTASLDEEQDYLQAFKLYDRRNKGYFQFQDYRYVCEGIAKELSISQIHQAFEGIDLQGNGKITYQQFVKIMKG